MILITGGTGLLGSHLINNLIGDGEKVKVLIRNQQSKEKLESQLVKINDGIPGNLKNIAFVLGDIVDTGSLHNAFQDIEYVYHCAAVVSFNRSDQKTMLETNIRGTANVVNACLQFNIKKLVHVSSIAAMNDAPEEEKFVRENSGWPTGKDLDYSYSKTESEFEVWRGISEGLNAVIVNPSVILGEGSISSGCGLFFKRVYDGMKYFTQGVTGFVDIRDVVFAMVTLMKSKISAERFILNSENLSYKDFFTSIAKYMKAKPPQWYAGKRVVEIAWRLEKLRSALIFKKPALTKKTARSAHQVSYYSSDKIINALNFSFIPVEKSISRIAKYYLKEFHV